MPSALTFSFVYLLAGASGITAFALTWRRRAAPGGRALAGMLLAAAFWALCDAVELQVPTVAIKQLVSQIQYLGVVSAAPFFFHAAWELSGSRRSMSPGSLALVWGVPLASLVAAWTNGWHHWLWTWIAAPATGSPFATYHYGWWFWVLTVQHYVLMVGATVVLIRSMRRVGRHFRAGMAFVVIAVLLPWIGNVAYNLKLGPWPGLNWLTLSLGVSGALLAWVVQREGLLDLLPRARDVFVEAMTDGVLVIDRYGRTIYANAVAAEAMALDDSVLAAALGFTSLSEAPEVWRADVELGHRWLDVCIAPVPDRWGAVAGRLVVARDITLQRTLEEEREGLIRELQTALGKVTQLEGLLPICAHCRKIRDDGGYWAYVEDYLGSRAPVEFTHAICPECISALYPEILDDRPAAKKR